MIRIAVCDDEPHLLEAVCEKVQTCCGAHKILAVMTKFHSGRALLCEIEDGAVFDLLLLDIEMPEIDGLELAARIHGLLPDALMIFVTSHFEYAVDAYELSIFRYIPKQQMDVRLEHALLDAAAYLRIQNNASYIIDNQNRIERILLKNIRYIRHEEKNAVFYTAAGIYRVRKTLAQIMEELEGDDFYMIDRGCIVNLCHVTSVRSGMCILNDGTELPVALSRNRELKETLHRYWRQKL